MDTLEDQVGFPIFDTYRRLVRESRELGRIRVRQSLYVAELGSRIKSFGGVHLWVGIVVLSAVGLVALGSQSARWLTVLGWCSIVILSYAATLTSVAGIWADLSIIIRGQSLEDWAYDVAARTVCNRFTMLIALPALILLVALLGIFSPSTAHKIVVIMGMLALIGFVGLQLNWTLKHFRDYTRIVAAVLGRETVVTLTTEELVAGICNSIQKADVSRSRISSLSRLAETDIRRAEFRLELANLTLALGAIFVSILLSQQLVKILGSAFRLVNEFLRSFSQTGGGLLMLSGQLRWLFVEGLYIVMWLFAVNILIGIGFLLSRSLLSIYFSYYRPAQALHQALIIMEHNNPKAPRTPVSPRSVPFARLLRRRRVLAGKRRELDDEVSDSYPG